MGREYIIFGRPAFFNGSLSLVHPEVESTLAQQNRPAAGVQGVYSTTEKLNNERLGTKAIYNLVCNAWALAGERIARDAAAAHPRRVPAAVAARRAARHPLSRKRPEAQSRRTAAQVRGTLRRAARDPRRPAAARRQEQRFSLHHCRRKVQPLLQRAAPLPANRRAEACDSRNPAGHRHRPPDEPPAARGRGQRQNARRADEHADRGRQRLPGLPDGPDRNPRRTTLRHHFAADRRDRFGTPADRLERKKSTRRSPRNCSAAHATSSSARTR